jgi:hypothetical protein
MNAGKTTGWLVTLLTVGVAFSITGGCDQGDYATATCAGVSIPPNGCPTDEDNQECSDSCDCAAAYNCVSGSWSLAVTCPNFDPDAATCPRPESPDAGGSGSPDAASCLALDLPAGATAGQGPGCIDLQDDDCAVGVVECTRTSCLELGCGGLFYCLEGNWYPWGYCAPDGGVVQTR